MNNIQEPNEVVENKSPLTPHQNTETAAQAYAAAGLSVLPLALPDKNPVIPHWKSLQTTIASPVEIASWYTRPNTQVGIICGSVSNGVEIIDFDEKHNIHSEGLFDRFKRSVQEIAPGLIDRLVIESTVSNGFHLAYRCEIVENNKKLARRQPTQEETQKVQKENESSVGGKKAGPLTLIETRSEGGYCMAAPSQGYTLLQGSFEHLPTISSEERTILLNCAKAFDEVIEQSEVFDFPAHLEGFTKRPGDDFNRRGSIKGILREAGWKMVGKHHRGEYWRRPEKQHGVSASLLIDNNGGPSYFYVFTTNASPFRENKHHSLFTVYTLLKHAGSWTESAKALAQQGFGSTVLSDAEEYLSERYHFRLNEITQKTEFKRINESEFVQITDKHLNSLYRELQKFHIKIGLEQLAGLLHSDFVPSYDPFTSYYENLKAWDGRIDFIGELARTVTLTDPALQEAFSKDLKKWLVNMVACAVNPSVVNHNAIILVGAQGRYKTTWLNRLVPSPLSQYKFIGTINPDNKDTLIHLSECILVNLDELETLRKAEIGSLKSVMTLQHIHVRRPYGRIAENLIRRASFVGSINRSEFLNDETGTRRFLTYEIDSIDLGTQVDIDAVHAQAYSLWKQGYQYWFDSEEIAAVNKRNAQFAIRSTEDELIDKMIEPGIEGDTSCKWKSATEIAVAANFIFKYSLTNNSARAFGVAMKKRGFISKRTERGMFYAVNYTPEIELNLKRIQPASGQTEGPANVGQTV